MKFKEKEKFVTDIKDLLSRYIAARGKLQSSNFYFGKVVDNIDPQKMGRIKVRVFQVFDGLDDIDLPFALPDYSSSGEMIIPTVGSLVRVYFENEDFNFPHYTTKILPKDGVNSEILEDYPHSMIIFDTENGDLMKINKKKNEFTLRLGSGTLLFCDADGNLDIDATGADTGNIKIKTEGKVTIDAGTVELAGSRYTGVASLTPTAGFHVDGIDRFTGTPIGTTTLNRSV